MFDFAWSEIGLIAVVALVFIGPKDMPVAIKTISGLVKKARKMAAEFQTHVDEMVREADLGEVRDQITKIRNFDLRGEIERAVDSDGTISKTFATNPLDQSWSAPSMGGDQAVAERPAEAAQFGPPVPAELVPPEPEPEPEPPHVPAPLPPAFLPPGIRVPEGLLAAAPRTPPAFIPPAAARIDPVLKV